MHAPYRCTWGQLCSATTNQTRVLRLGLGRCLCHGISKCDLVHFLSPIGKTTGSNFLSFRICGTRVAGFNSLAAPPDSDRMLHYHHLDYKAFKSLLSVYPHNTFDPRWIFRLSERLIRAKLHECGQGMSCLCSSFSPCHGQHPRILRPPGAPSFSLQKRLKRVTSLSKETFLKEDFPGMWKRHEPRTVAAAATLLLAPQLTED